MKKTTCIILLFLSTSAICAEIPEWLIGKWKSNEELTLNDMHTHKEITNQARNLFENDFFGRLVHAYRKNDAAIYFNDEEQNAIKYGEYINVESVGNSVTITAYNEEFGEVNGNTLYRDGDCYYIVITKWNFKEYFTAVPLTENK